MRWQPTSLTRGHALAFCAHEGVLLAALCDATGGVYSSGDGGSTWRPGRGLPEVPVVALTSTASGLLAGTIGRGAFRSSDGGATWKTSGTGLPEAATVVALVAHKEHLFAGILGTGLYRSHDGGTTWAASDDGLPLGGRLAIHALAADDAHVYASHAFGLHASTDSGDTWTPIGGGLPAGRAFVLLAAEGGGVYASDTARLYHAAPEGRTWTWTQETPWGGGLLRALVHRLGLLVAGTQGATSGIFSSADGGASWQSVREGLPAQTWSISLGVDGEVLLAGVAGHGVWRRPLADIAGPEQGAVGTASPFVLEQNEPNPFFGSTRIPYRLDAPSRVTLDVCDLQGNVLATPLSAVVEAGTHTVGFDGAQLPAGLYLYRLTVGALSQVRQMVLLK